MSEQPLRSWNEVRDEMLEESAEFRREYERLGPLYGIISDVLSRRHELCLSQSDLAERMGKQQPSIARFESGSSENPTLAFLQQLAEALDARLTIRLEPKERSGKPAPAATRERIRSTNFG